MILQILPPDFQATSKASVVDFQLLLVIIALAVGVFITIKVAKYFSKMKAIKKPNFASFF